MQLLRASMIGVWGVVCLSCGDDDPPAFALKPTIAEVPPTILDESVVQSCPVYQVERCEAGRQQRCDVYDTRTSAFTDAPDPILKRVLLYDRWYDLYMSPNGLTAERVFIGPMAPDTPESEWSKPSNFADWAGLGDAGIWTGAALVSDTYRYLQTRTEADYQRMEAKTRTLLLSFEVTGIPGYLSRFHFLQVPEGTPPDDQVIHRSDPLRPIRLPIPDKTLPGLPAAYASGDARWDGDVSIDQYTGPMMAFPIVHNLLRDEALKQKLVYQLTCYLKRLQRIEVINLKARPDLLVELQKFFGGGTGLKLDPDDPDITSLSSMVWYVHRGINTTNAETFDKTCPDTVQLKPWRVIDARDPLFETALLELATDINRDIRNRENQIDHFYIPSVRGGDASHLMHLAALAYYFTGEEQYKSFLFDELIGTIRANEVARTMMAFRLPDWCFRFYGDHITYGTHWQFLTMLPDGDLKNEMMRVMEEEIWQKALYNHESVKFNVMYAASMPNGSGRDAAIASIPRQLAAFGGLGSTLDSPRRTYNRPRADIIASFPSGTTVRCPSEAERMACEDGGTLLGFPLESATISHVCDGRAGECSMSDGMCVDGLASTALPANLRAYSDFMWQRSPFNIGDGGEGDGQKQSPGRDLTEGYWLARHYGLQPGGDGQVLGWNDLGTCN